MIVQDKEKNQIQTISLLILSIVAVAFALYFTRAIMIPFILALLLRIVIDPIIEFQVKKLHVHRFIAVVVSIVLIIGLFMIIIPIIIDSLANFLRSADDYNYKVLLLIEFLINKLKEFQIDIDTATIRESFLSLPFLDWASTALSNGANFVTKLFLVVIITLFLLIGPKGKQMSETWQNINSQIKTYIFTKFITSVSTGILTGIIYWFLGLDLALIFGTLTFLLNFIPTIGSIIAVLLPLPVAFLQFNDLTSVALIIAIPGLVHIIIGNFIEPKVFGKAFNLHPVTVIIALIAWGMLWGITGMLLAAPLTAIMRILFIQFETTKPFALLLSGKIHYKN
ncbi:MAG: AI-2 transport protein TqsA [Alphaproteobacteria bacterium MarineAlpha5_Bin9]|nr:MAG: AI-2 transport protein TqsA [Alphaproteobacteria bacterium MarineAlpha5_Bin9]|tara:strand:- start:6564 stop:7577 length:1014 start_codon:yes stop_codon:yes gene_type:complete